MIMKYKIIILAILLFPMLSFCQIDKLGMSKKEVLSSMDKQPCKANISEIWYCMPNGNLINYGFKNEQVHSVLYMWEFKSKEDANQDVEKEVAKYKNEYGRPELKNGAAFWFSGKNLIQISYGYSNGKHYSCFRLSIWE